MNLNGEQKAFLLNTYKQKVTEILVSIEGLDHHQAANRVNNAISFLRREQPDFFKKMGDEAAEKRDMEKILTYLLNK